MTPPYLFLIFILAITEPKKLAITKYEITLAPILTLAWVLFLFSKVILDIEFCVLSDEFSFYIYYSYSPPIIKTLSLYISNLSKYLI